MNEERESGLETEEKWKKTGLENNSQEAKIQGERQYVRCR